MARVQTEDNKNETMKQDLIPINKFIMRDSLNAMIQHYPPNVTYQTPGAMRNDVT